MDSGDRRRADRKTGVCAGRRWRQVPVTATPDYRPALPVIVATFARFGRTPGASVLVCHRLLGGDEMNRGTPAPAASSRRVRIAASSALALAVLIGGSLYLARGVFSPGPSSAGMAANSRTTATACDAAGTSPCANSPAAMAVAAAPVVVTVPPRHTAASAHPTKAAPSASMSAHSSAPG